MYNMNMYSDRYKKHATPCTTATDSYHACQVTAYPSHLGKL
jgi:hypothetical protein